MKTSKIITYANYFILILLLILITMDAYALDYPHTSVNNIGCDSCHYVYAGEPDLLPPWTSHVQQDIDDTPFNTLCWGCHNDIDAPYVRTHSSLQIDISYGYWTVECRTCHDPHTQPQIREHGSDSYLYSGISTSITSTTLTQDGAGWTEDEYQDRVLIPNVDRTSRLKYGYKITGNTSDTLTVEGPIDLSRVTPGVDTFAIIYGNIVQSEIILDEIIDPGVTKTGSSTVRFFYNSGTNSFADGNSTYDGVCEVCHTETNYHTNDGSGSVHNTAADCTQCHNHVRGFAHGGGGAGGDCEECHGHDPGYGGFTGGAGTFSSHSTHTEDDADDLRGPHIDCDTCHDTSRIPYFLSGTDSNGDGRYDLSETDVCDTCHSPGGAYDGINDAELGAKYGNSGELKYNWSNGIYNSDGVLKTGNEKWCATCHDDSPSQIQGIDAPNVIGDEGAATNYGIGYGFYKTGHGLSGNDKYPESGGTITGAGLSCDYCHDLTMKHIDGVARTYVYTATVGNDDDYQHGYRLKSINGEQPMDMPRADGCESGVEATDFRLCFSCHDSGPFTNPSDYNTNFRHTGTPDFNAHYSHLAIQDSCDYGPVFTSDWKSHGNDSRASCVTCHNVHGSEQLAMVRDGNLVGRAGLPVLYYKPGVSFDCFNYPDIRDVSVAESTGTIYSKNPGGLCSACHGSCGFEDLYLRSPFDNTPPRITRALGQVGSDTLTVDFSENVYSDLNSIGDLLIADFALTDSDDSRMINGVSHVAGDDSAVLTLDSALDATDDIGNDTIAAATGTSIYDENNLPMGTSPVTITEEGGSAQTIIHPSGLDTSTDCSPVGGAWADILDSDDGDTSYADCYSYYDEMMSELYTASFKMAMDDASGLDGATINQLTARAVVNLTSVSGGGGPPSTVAYLQICYETGGTGQECSTLYDLDGTEGYVEIFIGNTVDPDGNPLDLDDINNLEIEVILNADDCCGAADATAHVTEVYAEIDYTLLSTDTVPPTITDQIPANGSSGVDVYSNLTFTLADGASGVDWNTLEVELTGDGGYAKLYTDADFQIISKTGYPDRYFVTVNPDADFGDEEVITVTVRVDDYFGNSLTPPAWSFTTASAPLEQTVTLHPSGEASTGGFSTTGGTWADVLDTNDGDASYAYFCCSSPGQTFYVDMDDPGLGGAVIQSLTFHVYARYKSSPGGGPYTADVNIGYRTGAATEWRGIYTTDTSGSYNLVSSITYTTDSDGGGLDLTDINNLQIAVQRNVSGSPQLQVTEVYVDVVYFP